MNNLKAFSVSSVRPPNTFITGTHIIVSPFGDFGINKLPYSRYVTNNRTAIAGGGAVFNHILLLC